MLLRWTTQPNNNRIALVPPDLAEPNRTKRPTHTKLYERGMGALIWLAFAALGIAALYAASLLND